VLFVSHNMAAIESLCTRCVVLAEGCVAFDGGSAEGVARYLSDSQLSTTVSLARRTDRQGSGNLRITEIALGIEGQEHCGFWQTGKTCVAEFSYECKEAIHQVDIGMSLVDMNGKGLIYANTSITQKRVALSGAHGKIYCRIQRLPVYTGEYYMDFDVYHNGVLLDYVQQAALIFVEHGDYYGTGTPWGRYGAIYTDFEWGAS